MTALVPPGGTLRSAVLAMAFLAWSATSAFAFDPVDLERLLATGRCASCDLSGVVISDLDLVAIAEGHIDLRGADLRGAELVGTRLSGANLAGADLRGARLDLADLTDARLRGADLSGATAAFSNFGGADLAGALMVGFNACYHQSFAGANLRGVNARGATLCASDWTVANIAGADFRDADLTLATGLTQAQLDWACGNGATALDPEPSISACLAE
jgi:uncharacterized protein YjbI with pentapeptide repeats